MILKPVLGTQLQSGSRLADRLVDYWLMSEGAGTIVNNLSGFKNTGSLVGNAAWTPGKFGWALDFNGSGDRINLANNASPAALPITVSAFVRYDRTASARIIDSDGHSGNYYGFLLTARTTGVIDVSYGDGGPQGPSTRRSATSSLTMTANQWHHIIAVIRGATDFSIILDGIEDDNLTYSGSGGAYAQGLTPGYIGSQVSVGFFDHEGQLDVISIYNRDPSAREIAELLRNPFVMFHQEPIELWTAATSVGAPAGLSIPIAMHHYKQLHGAA